MTERIVDILLDGIDPMELARKTLPQFQFAPVGGIPSEEEVSWVDRTKSPQPQYLGRIATQNGVTRIVGVGIAVVVAQSSLDHLEDRRFNSKEEAALAMREFIRWYKGAFPRY